MWDTHYTQPGYAFGMEPNDFLCSVADRIPTGSVLCLGDGEGCNGVFLAERGYAVTSMDSLVIGMQKATTLAQVRRVPLTTTVADLAHYSILPAAWDGIVSIGVITKFPQFADLVASSGDVQAIEMTVMRPGWTKAVVP